MGQALEMFTSGADDQYWRAKKGSRKGPSRSVGYTISDTPRKLKMRNKILRYINATSVPFA
jgi:hypothetical protein